MANATTVIETSVTAVEVIETSGRQGPPGPKGDPGPQGDPGPRGETGAGITMQGTAASVADLPNTGNPGDAYAVGGRIYMRTTAGAWVDTGPVGIPGKDGQIRFTGHGDPPVVIAGASPGDTYLDLDTGNVFKLV